MSGHSKWANIRVKKTAQDSKRGKVFTRHARLIEIAAHAGGVEPEMNPQLRTAIENARVDSVPNANIDRAIQKGTGALKGEQMTEVMYAAHLPLRSSDGAKGGGPGGVACLIECLTDNKNRTVANIKNIIQKHGGSFVEVSSVQWMFARKGIVVARISNLESRIFDEIELRLIDFGAEDIDVVENTVTVTTDAAHWANVRDLLKDAGFEILSAGLAYVPSQTVALKDSVSSEKLSHFVELLEEDDDVSEVHTNAEIVV